MGDHAKLSPSARHRWQLCPGSVRMEAQYPEGGTPSAAATDGTHTHTLLEYCVKRLMMGLDGNANSFIGVTLKDDDGEFTVDAARAERVEFAMEYLRGRSFATGATIKAEEMVDPKYLLGRDDMTGTVDVQLICPEVLEVIDYKDGMGVVDAVDNPQLEQYVFGALSPFYRDGIKLPEWIRMTIIQPKLRELGQAGISHHEVLTADFVANHRQIVNEANATDAKDAPLVAGEKQCRYCAHGGNCSERTTAMLAKAGIKFGSTETVLKQTMEKSPLDLTPAQFREIIEALPMIRTWLDGVEEAALAKIQSGTPIEGLKAVRGRGMRSWALPEEELQVKLTKMGVPKKEIWETKIISPAKVEKLRWTKKDGTTKQLTPNQLKMVQEDFVKKSDGKLTVVSAADDRPAVDFGDAAKLFGAADDQIPSWLTV